jgi:type IV pilus assembly protein PilW
MKRNKGFSLIELLIAVTLGLLLTNAIISAFLSVKKVSSTTSGTAALADGGRIGLAQIEQSVRAAGYFACGTSATVQNDLAATASPVLTDFVEPLSGYEFTGTGVGASYTLPTTLGADGTAGDWATSAALGSVLDPVLAATAGSTVPGGIVPGSDVLAVHSSLPGTVPVYLTASSAVGVKTFTTTLATAPGNTAFVAILNGGQLPVGVLSNCQSSEVFAISSAAGAVLTMSGAGNAQATLFSAYSAGARISVATTRIYYIGVGQDGLGSLFVADTSGALGFAAPVELVSDIDNMQVLYGIDTDGSQRVGQYVTAEKVALLGTTHDFNSVINVRIALLSAGPVGSADLPAVAPVFTLLGTQVTVPKDTRLRKIFTTTIALRNRAG